MPSPTARLAGSMLVTTPIEPDELHISSAVIHLRPERTQEVARTLAALPGTDVFYAHGGKIIVTLESAATITITGQLDRIAQLEGVLATTLVYHEIALPEELGEPVCS